MRLLLAFFTMLLPTIVSAQSPLWNGGSHGSYNPNLVSAWYRNYLNRNPQPQESSYIQLEYNKGRNHFEIQGYILGSEEYFINKCGRSNDRFITELFVDVYERNPAPNESNFWVRKLRDYGNDRVKFSRDFVRQASGNISAFPPPITGTPNPPADASDIPYGNVRALTNQMHAVSQQMERTIPLELGGSFQGRTLLMHARNLHTNTERLEAVAQQFPPGTQQFNIALDGVNRSWRAFQGEMYSVSGVSFTLNQLTNRYNQLLAALTGNAIPQPPIIINPGNPNLPPVANYPPNSSTEVFQLSTRLSNSLQRLASSLQTPYPVPYDRVSPSSLARDAYALSTASGELAAMAAQGYSAAQLRNTYVGIRNQARILDQNLKLMGRTSLQVQAAWSDAESSLIRLTVLILGNNSDVLYPPTPGPIYNQQLTQIDQNLAELDAFMTSVAPLSWTVPGMPRFVAECQELRTHLLALRRIYQTGTSPVDIQMAQQQVQVSYSQVNSLWRNIQNNSGTSLPDFGRFRQSMDGFSYIGNQNTLPSSSFPR